MTPITAGTAVLYRQISVFIHAEYIIALRITACQSIAVQIQRYGTVDRQRGMSRVRTLFRCMAKVRIKLILASSVGCRVKPPSLYQE